jgi:hypothetical protein
MFMVCKRKIYHVNKYIIYINRIGGVMVSVLASSVVDRGVEPRSGALEYLYGETCN